MDLDKEELKQTKEKNGANVDYKRKIEKEIAMLKKNINILAKHIDTEKYEYALKLLEKITKE